MNWRIELEGFTDGLLAESLEHGGYQILRAAIAKPGVAILVYFWQSTDRLCGRAYRNEDLHLIYGDERPAPAVYASDIAATDFCSPPGRGVKRDYPWESALRLGRNPVYWCEGAGWLPELAPVLHYADPEWDESVVLRPDPSRGANVGNRRRVSLN